MSPNLEGTLPERTARLQGKVRVEKVEMSENTEKYVLVFLAGPRLLTHAIFSIKVEPNFLFPSAMEIVTQLSISLPNNPGSLARMTDILRAADVNIEALFITNSGPMSIVHLVVNDPETAKIVLEGVGPIIGTEVIAYKVHNRPGAIADLARTCAGVGINIRHIYATSLGKEAMCYLDINDLEKAKEALK